MWFYLPVRNYGRRHFTAHSTRVVLRMALGRQGVARIEKILTAAAGFAIVRVALPGIRFIRLVELQRAICETAALRRLRLALGRACWSCSNPGTTAFASAA